MESFGNLFDEEWDNLSRMFSGDQDSGHGLNFEVPTMFLPASNESSNADSFVVEDDTLVYISDNINPNFYHFLSQESSNSSNGASNGMVSLSYPCHESYHFSPSNTIDVHDQSVGFCMMDDVNNSLVSAHVFSDDAMNLVKMENLVDPGRQIPLKRKFEMPKLPNGVDDEVNNEKNDKNPKKRSRVLKDNKNKKNVQPKKNQKIINVVTDSHANDTDNNNNNNNNIGEGNGQTSTSCSSEDDSNGSQDFNGALNSNGKTRASRGTATDPQSLYARKRRERINERLRILQNLVPNGTKVDISTMLEEAVQYVNFLKLQIKLLSSDDMWMYAPIAYNGMDMGLYQNLAPTL